MGIKLSSPQALKFSTFYCAQLAGEGIIFVPPTQKMKKDWKDKDFLWAQHPACDKELKFLTSQSKESFLGLRPLKWRMIGTS